MNTNEIQKLLSLGEGQRVEFKASYEHVGAIGAIVCGLLNTSGGYVVCGVAAEGTVTGVDASPDQVARLERQLHDGLSPKALVSVQVRVLEGKPLVVVEVPAGQDVPYAFRDRIYMRSSESTRGESTRGESTRGESTRKADGETIRDLSQRRQIEPERWERRFSFADLESEVDADEIHRFVSAAKKVNRAFFRDAEDLIKILEDLAVVKYGRLTNGGDVLFAQNPAVRLPQVRVRASCYPSSKASNTFRDMKSFEGPLVSVLEQTYAFIVRNTATVATFSASSLRRDDRPLYPEMAVVEALVNAFAHRDYASSAGGVTVGIYPERLEIWNSGSLPEGVTPEKLRSGRLSVLRNPDIAHVLYLRGQMERVGRGGLLIRTECEEFGLPAPKWESEGISGVTITLFAPQVPTDSKGLVPVTRSVAIGAPSHLARQPASIAAPKVAPTRLTHVAEELFGREGDLAKLDAAWADEKIHVITLVAWGGVGKTSLVAKWAAEKDLGGADYFDWSFYSQGTREEGSASGEPFLAAALRFFGEEDGEKIASSTMSAWDKGSKLAGFIAKRRALLILDGLEPLQYPPSSPLAGQLKDPGLTALLRGLAAQNPGLCIVTTRESVKDLAAFHGGPAPEWKLERLGKAAGVALLEKLQVKGSRAELEKLVEDVRGHALTLSLIGSYLRDAHGGDVRKRDLVEFEEADREEQGGHAFRVIATYEHWLAPKQTLRAKVFSWSSRKRENRAEGERQLAILRLLGLFDRPAPADCLAALRRAPRISGLTEPLQGISEANWNFAVSRLASAGLASVEGAKLDAHPLVREYFARELREIHPEAWRAANRRLFEHLRDTTENHPDTLEGLQPLYQAVAHGCHAGRYEEACTGIYRDRIQRGGEAYSTKKLGALGADLGAVACFFDPPWRRVSAALSEANQAWLLNEAAYSLRALGRLTEALEPMRVSMEMDIARSGWDGAGRSASNLSELELTLGDVPAAVRDAEQSVTLADRSGDAFLRLTFRTTHADALHQAGRQAEALALFREAERLQEEMQPVYPRLYSLQGFRYCDLLLAEAERAAGRGGGAGEDGTAFSEAIREVEERAAGALLAWQEIFTNEQSVLDNALDHLTLGCAALYGAILAGSDLAPARAEIEQAVDGLRRAGQQIMLPRGLLTRAWLLFLEGNPAAARADLDEVQEIAERGPMTLFLADVALTRARLFGDRAALAEARRLIEKHGYGRRLGELADAEAAFGAILASSRGKNRTGRDPS